jgi:putative transposase
MFKSFYPPHIYQDNSIYFITAHAKDHNPILITDAHKQIFWETLNVLADEYDMALLCWTINLNHYHILIQLQNGDMLSTIMKKLHGKTSYLLNKLDAQEGRQVWVNYWDRIIRSETDLHTRINYIHHNCVKHGYSNQMEKYKWSSYAMYLEKFGKEWVDDSFQKFPIVDFTLECPD